MRHILVYITLLVSSGALGQCSCEKLINAVLDGDSILVKECIANGADPNCFIRQYEKVVNEVPLSRERTFTHVYEWYKRPMAFAIEANKLDMVKLLHESGASINSGKLAIRDTLHPSREGISYEVPMTIAKEIARVFRDSSIYIYLYEQGSVSIEVQAERGRRFDQLFHNTFRFLSDCYEEDSVLMCVEMLNKYGDGIKLNGIKKIFETSMYYSLDFVFDYLDYDDYQPWNFTNDGVIFYNDLNLIQSVAFGGKETIEFIEELIERDLVSYNEIRTTLLSRGYYKKNNSSLYKYYKAYFENQEADISNFKHKCNVRKMEKMRQKLHEKNALENRYCD